jgi:hypothetical protein
LVKLEDLRAHVGLAEYQHVCEEAWRSAPTVGRDRGQGFDSQVPHDLSYLVWASEGSCGEKLRLLFQLYQDMPCYALLMYLADESKTFDGGCRDLMWAQYARYLTDPAEELAGPIKYSLWCDWFEDPTTVGEAWDQLIEGANGRALRRLLEMSGPVPWALKKDVLKRLAPEPAWQQTVFSSLLYAAFDSYGKIDKVEAGEVLEQLEISKDHEDLDRLKRELGVP